MPQKNLTFKIDSRFKGMSDDVRIQDLNFFQVSLHNDLFVHPKNVRPYRNTETDTTNTDYRITRGLIYGTKLYGLGRKAAASNFTKIYEKSSNIITDSWTASTTGEDSSGTPDFNCFIQYEGLLYGFANSTRIWAYKVSTNTFSATALDLTSYTNSAQGIVTGDGLLLMPYDNKIAVKNSGSDATSNWETARLTLPSTLRIMDIEEWGEQVAIVCQALTAENSHSYLYLWNKIDADISTRVDLGEGQAQLVGDIDGELCVVMLVGGESSANHFKGRIVVKKFLGGTDSQTIVEVECDTSAITIQRTTKIKDQTRMKWAMKCVIDGTTYHNMWVLGRKKEGYPIMLSMDYLMDSSTPTSVEGAWKVGQYHWFSINSGTVMRTNNDGTYTAISTFISQKIQTGPQNLKLKWVGVVCPPLPAGSTITLYYRVDSGSWTEIFAYSTTNGLGHQAGVADVNGDGTSLVDFTSFGEIQFKLTTTGGTSSPAEWNSIEGEFIEVGNEMVE